MNTGAHGAAIRRMCLRVVLPWGEMSLYSYEVSKGEYMTIKHIEEYHCDRCKRVFQQRESGFADTLTMAIGWFLFRNGSGSKNSSIGRQWENLDYDLCDSCTEEFQDWWVNPPERD